MTKRKNQTKMDICSKIVEQYILNPEDERRPKDIKEELMKKAKLSKPAANTYYYLIRDRILQDEY